MKAYSVDLREKVLRAVDQAGLPTKRDYQALWGLTGHDQTLPQAAARDRACERQTDSWSPFEEICSLAGWVGCPITGVSRCHLGDALPDVGARARLAGEHEHDGSCHQTRGVDAKKTVGAEAPTERK